MSIAFCNFFKIVLQKLLQLATKCVIINKKEGVTMDNKEIGKRIKQVREMRNISQEELGNQLGLNKSSIQRYESGQVQRIKLPILENMAKILNVDPSWLILKSNIMSEYHKSFISSNEIIIKSDEKNIIWKYRSLDEHGKKIVNLLIDEEFCRCTSEPEEGEEPTITIKHSFHKVSAGHGFDLNNEDDWEEIEVPDTPEARRADFSLTISGDSMEPIYSDGDIVLVKSQPSVDIGETGIFIVNGSGFIKKNGGDRLISLNPEYDDITFCDGDTVSCVGRVIGKA